MPRRDFILACTFACVLSAGSAHAADKVVLGMIGAGSTAHWPSYIAIEKGIYAKHGLDIDVIVVPSNPAMQQQIAVNALNIGTVAGSPDPIRAVDKGAPTVILRIDTPASPYSLVSKADIKTPSDLKNRTVSLDGPKGITRAYFDRVMKPTGLKEGDFDLVFQGATPARFAALQSGVADAAMLTAPFDSFAEAQGFKQLVLVDDVVKDIPFGVTVGNRPWVLAHKDVVLRFFAAYREAVDWFYDPKNRAEAVQIGLRNTKQKAADLEKAYDFFNRIAFFSKTDTVSKKQLETVMDVLIGFHDIEKRIPIERLIAPEVTKVID